MKTGLESLDTGAPEITYSGNEGPKSPQQMQQMQRMQMAELEEEYDAYVDDMIEQGIEPMSMQQFLEQIAIEAQMSSNEEGIGGMMEDPRQMAANGGVAMQGGVRNYLGKQKTVSDVPLKWQSGSDKPATELAYITKAEKDLLLKKDIHGSLKKGPNKGPEGIMSLDSAGDKDGPVGGFSGADVSAAERGETPSSMTPSQASGFRAGVVAAGGGAKSSDTDAIKKEAEKISAQVAQRKAEQDKATQEKFNLRKAFKKFNQVRYNLARGLPGATESSFNNLKDYRDYLESQGVNPDTINRLMEGVTKDKAIGFDKFQELAYGYEPKGITDIDKLRELFGSVDESGKYKPPTTRGPFDKITAVPQNFSDFMLTKKNNPNLFAAGNVGNFMDMPKPKDLVNPNTGELYTNSEWNDLKREIGQDRGLTGSSRDDTPRTMTTPSDPGDPNDPDDPANPTIPTDPVTGQYLNQYLIPGASSFYSNLPSTMFNPTTNMLTLADGGRANYAGGGIADLRQGYFLGKIVKSITKPFKKAFRGFKKIAKSPMGKMALLALGGYYLGGGTKLGGSLFGNQGFGTSRLASMFTGGGGPKFNLGGFSKLGEGFKNIAKSAFKPENAFATISGISGLSGLYTNYINNKREDESMEEYQRRLEEERRNFAPIPTDFVQFAANGGRMGFADGGDDDDDESFRQKALGALYSMKRPQFSMGGGAGMPPVTMMSEGQDVQSFGDDESTGMPQATPTMPNQMPMRPPMMDPRMQQQMMMQQRMNPMMNRGMMSMQQPRIMAQEGGMMDMGGMEKDYRNEGGFVAIGGQERADDVPARLSKNEFVFTADAVRNAGGGDIDRGAEIMENMMENLEAGGKISEASQGLKGAREMFATQQRLGEVL